MGKATKATKRFQKKHLTREITNRRIAQKKNAQREKSLSKYTDKDDREAGSGGEDEEQEDESGLVAEEDVFSTKAKSKPIISRAHKTGTAAPTSGPKAAAPKKAPGIEELDVDSFLDAAFLDDEAQPKIDQKALEDDEDEEEDEQMEEGEEDGEEEVDDAALLAEIEQHERELANLAKSDPEFYSHLQKHDKDLLSFSKKQFEDEEEEEDADGMDGVDLEEDEAAQRQPELEVLTWESLQALKKSVMGPSWSIRGLKKLIRVFRSAVHIGEVNASKVKGTSKMQVQSEAERRKEAAFRQEVQIHSARVFNDLVRFVFNQAYPIFSHHFKAEGAQVKKEGGEQDASVALAISLDKHPRWSSLGPVLKAFLGHVLHFLSTLHANPQMARFTLGSASALERFLPLFLPFPKLAAKLLKELLRFWSEGERDVRIDAFLRMRQMAIQLSRPGVGGVGKGGESMLELTLKGIYLTYVRHSKFASALTLPIIEFMANCVVEIYGLDPTLAYQHAFVYIRQLAIHLRQALLTHKKEAHRAVYNWNFVNCLRVWCKVLAAHGQASSASAGQNGALAAADHMHALVYPLVQISLGTLTLMPSSRYFPLRFHVTRMLLDLTAATHVFIPLAPHLLSVLQAPELQRKPSSSTRKINDLQFVLRVSKHVLSSKQYQESVVSESLHLLLRYFSTYSYSISFNELVLPTIKQLKKVAKEVVIQRVRKQIQQFVLRLEHNASWIATKRNACNWAPKDLMEKKGVDGIDTFNPARSMDGGEVGKKKAAQQISPLAKYVEIQMEERKALDEAKADWDGSQGSRSAEKKAAKADAAEEDEDEYDDANMAGEEDDDDMDEADFDDEDDDDEDDDEEDEAPARKKAKQASGGASPRKPFQYPKHVDEQGEGDVLEELAFSDEEDDKPAKGKKQKKQQPKSSQKKKNNKGKKEQSTPVKKEKQNTPVKKEGQANGKAKASPAADKKRKRA